MTAIALAQLKKLKQQNALVSLVEMLVYANVGFMKKRRLNNEKNNVCTYGIRNDCDYDWSV
jgi:hypothetical protein